MKLCSGQLDVMKLALKKFIRALGVISAALAVPGIPAQAAGPALLAPAPSPAPPAPAVQAAQPALWKIADEDTTIYLFGTVHLLQNNTNWLTPKIASALASSDQLVTEVDLDASKASAPDFVSRGLLPEGQSLRAMMTRADRAAFEKAMQTMGLPVNAFDRFKPWYAGMMLNLLPLMKQGYSGNNGVEAVLAAKKDPKTATGALETVGYQLDLFDSMPKAQQLSYLRSVVDALPDIKTTIAKMVDEWLAGDADGLANLINDPKTDPALLERLLYARNAHWADWIAERMKQPGTVFIAVGAGHLAGKGSVQDELSHRGIASARVQ